MRALQLDYQRSVRPIPWLGLGVLASALVALALMASHYHQLGQHIALWEARAAHVERLSSHRARALLPLSGQAAREQALEVQHANQVLRKLSLPWDMLFRAVESAGGESVALLSMEPDIQKGTVRISGEAKNFAAMLDYIRQLGARDVFGSVHLQNHQIRQDDPQKPVRFSLLAAWKVEAT
jgi:Tfp pilus assembly protein PilN